ncbi:MAG TPA: hypothetical protein VN368_00905 [Candidatus Methylomirabilis sp.]|nr:hypothetical protein [Candidatus Methylomirabilis sp.]
MKFRKKPVVINAFQTNCELTIRTLEGEMTAHPGDWIIKGVNGELYPCKPDIFEKTYEPVEEKIIAHRCRKRRLDGAWRKKRSDAGKKRK